MLGIDNSQVLLLLALVFLSWVVRKVVAFQQVVRSIEYVSISSLRTRNVCTTELTYSSLTYDPRSLPSLHLLAHTQSNAYAVCPLQQLAGLPHALHP